MLKATPFRFSEFKKFDEEELLNGVYIVVLHATRIPPHIGMIVDKHYHSLTIKGQDYNTPLKALIKNIEQRKIPSLFIKVKAHSTFSNAYLKDHFILNVQQFPRVDKNIATCLSPIKLFFGEVYDVCMDEVHFLFELLPKLQEAALIEHSCALFVNEQNYQLPLYTQAELSDEIESARAEINQLTHSSLQTP